MSVALRTITRLQDADDVNVTLGAGVDEYALCWDNGTAKFVLRAPFAGILATGATVGATAQAQVFTLGVVSPFVAPAADGTAAWQVRKADKTTAVLTVDTTNVRATIEGNASGGAGATALIVKNAVSSNGYAQVSVAAASYPRVYFGNQSETFQAQFLYDIANTRMVFHNGRTGAGSSIAFSVGTDDYINSERMRITGAGLVGIGTASPATALHVVGAATITAGIRPAADSITALQLQNVAGTSVLNVDTTNARVGIGTTAPLAKTDVAVTLTNTAGTANGAAFYTTTMSPSANGTASIRNVQYELVSGNDKEISDATNMLMYQYASSYMVNLIGVNVASRYGATANVVTERMLYLSQDSKAGGAVIGTKTGLYIDAITHGNTNYAIYTNAGKLRFGDIVNFAGTMGDSAKNPATDAPADWVQIEIGGVTHYLPAYAAA